MAFQYPKEIQIVEVGPRDGLQNEKTFVPTTDKKEFIKNLAKSGLKTIEVTSFVRPDKIPQMRDSKELFNSLKGIPELEGVRLPCLVPNLKGLEAALECGVKEISVFTATSDSFNQKNINSTIQGSLNKIKPVIKEALSEGLKVRGYISTVFGCPYQGETSLDDLKQVGDFLLENGAYELSLGDTIGVARPTQVEEVLDTVSKNWELSQVALHFHNTYGRALANSLMALQKGVTIFDSSAGGLGGCPYAQGATGNCSTEDLVDMAHQMGIQTGVDLEKLIDSSEKVLETLGKTGASLVHQAYLAKRK
jgi:hydroxymethylglutaryl-CoA lyase